MQSTATEVKKLLVDDKITACVKEISLMGVNVCKVSNRRTMSGERFCFPPKSHKCALKLTDLWIISLLFDLNYKFH